MKKRNDLAVRAAALAGAALIGGTTLTGCGNRTPSPTETEAVTEPNAEQNGEQESMLERLMEFIPFLNRPEAVYGPPPEETPYGNTEPDPTQDPTPDPTQDPFGAFHPSENLPEPVYGPPPEPEVRE
jgi:hypothetical protein